MRLFALAGILLTGIAAAPLSAQEFSDAQKREIETVLRDYLLANPEVLVDAFTVLQGREAAQQAEARGAAVAESRDLLLNSPNHIVLGNPQGDVTLVEFFDYNCGFCRRALADLTALLEADDQLRVVLKEFPVLGPGSAEAAKVSMAVARVDPARFLAFHERLFGTDGPVDGEVALQAATAAGVDEAQLRSALQDDAVDTAIAESVGLAESLGLNGTPSYVIGDEVVIGAVGLEALQEKIADARD